MWLFKHETPFQLSTKNIARFCGWLNNLFVDFFVTSLRGIANSAFPSGSALYASEVSWLKPFLIWKTQFGISQKASLRPPHYFEQYQRKCQQNASKYSEYLLFLSPLFTVSLEVRIFGHNDPTRFNLSLRYRQTITIVRKSIEVSPFTPLSQHSITKKKVLLNQQNHLLK